MSNNLKTNVSELLNEIKYSTNRYVKNLVGELKELKFWNDTNCYAKLIDLKDRDKIVPITVFNYNTYFPNLKKNYKEGDVIVVSGRLNFNQKRSEISILIDDMKKENVKGDFSTSKKMNEKLAKKRGYLDKEKKDIDFTKIKNMAILTSISGEVVYDIIRHLPRYCGNIYVYNVNVQGSNCVKTNVNALNEISDSSDIELIVIARGGGSEEDLFEYNNIDLLEAVYKCQIPVISAIGHTQDNPLVCRVSDINCSTPTKVASLFNDKINLSENINKTKLSTLNNIFLQLYHENYSKIQSKEMSIKIKLNSNYNELLAQFENKKKLILENLKEKYSKKNLSILKDNKTIELTTKEDILDLEGKQVEIKFGGGTFKVIFPKAYDFKESTFDLIDIKNHLSSINTETTHKKIKGYQEPFDEFIKNQDLSEKTHQKKILHHLSEDIKLIQNNNKKINFSNLKKNNNYSIYDKFINDLNTTDLITLQKINNHLLYVKEKFDNVAGEQFDLNSSIFESVDIQLLDKCLRKKSLFRLLMEYKSSIIFELEKFEKDNTLNVWLMKGGEKKSITDMFVEQNTDSRDSSEDESYENSENENISEFYEFDSSSNDDY